MSEPTVKILFCHPGAKSPQKPPTDPWAAADDLSTPVRVELPPNETTKVPTGLKMEISHGWHGRVWGRSGGFAKGLEVHVGIIDETYRGEVLVAIRNHSGETIVIGAGERIAQFQLAPTVQVKYVKADALGETARAEGGFGSTGTGAFAGEQKSSAKAGDEKSSAQANGENSGTKVDVQADRTFIDSITAESTKKRKHALCAQMSDSAHAVDTTGRTCASCADPTPSDTDALCASCVKTFASRGVEAPTDDIDTSAQ